METAERDRTAAQLAAAVETETDPLVRAQLMRTLGHFAAPQVVAALAVGLEDGEADVRIAACEALGRIGDARSAELLSRSIAGDTDADVRLAALRAAASLDEPGIVAGIAVALDDPDPALQYRAIRSLEQVTGKYYGNDVGLWRQYAAGQAPAEPSPSVAERLRRLF
jgi:HEAT repeat protein